MHQRLKALVQISVLGVLLGGSMGVAAMTRQVDVYQLTEDEKAKGLGPKIGTITFEDSDKGMLIKPNLKDLPPGEHGFHIHQMPACEGAEVNGLWVPGVAAGPHLDPHNTHEHLGPDEDGHLGDLPVLIVDESGRAKDESLAPRLTVTDITHHSVIIHAGGDNYSDEPNPLGGGGARIACGRIH